LILARQKKKEKRNQKKPAPSLPSSVYKKQEEGKDLCTGRGEGFEDPGLIIINNT